MEISKIIVIIALIITAGCSSPSKVIIPVDDDTEKQTIVPIFKTIDDREKYYINELKKVQKRINSLTLKIRLIWDKYDAIRAGGDSAIWKNFFSGGSGNTAKMTKIRKLNKSLKTLKKVKLNIDSELLKVYVHKNREILESEFLNKVQLGPSNKELHIGNKVIKIYYGEEAICAINKYVHLSLKYQNKKLIENKYLKIDNKVKTVKFFSNNEKVLTINENGKIISKGLGNTVVTVSVDDYFINIPLKVIKIPIHYKMVKSEVLESMGYPDEVIKETVVYPESSIIGGIHYSTTNYISTHRFVEHWRYKAFPSVILRFSSNKLDNCIISSWENVDSTYYQLFPLE